MYDDNKNAVRVFNEMAEVYQQKYMNVDSYQECLDYFISKLGATGTIQDLACGPGNILKYLSEKNSNLNLEGIDLSVEMIRLAKLNVPNAKLEVRDCRDLNHLKSRYNGIVCSFLMPYLTEIEIRKLFTDIGHLLAPNGVLYLAFIHEENNRSEIVKSSKGHDVRMHYHSADFVTKLLHDNSFIVDHCKKYVSNNTNQKQNDFVIIASK